MTRIGVYPGSFNPPTTAHLAISEAALEQRRLDAVVWTVSRVALAKEDLVRPALADRLAVLEAVAAEVAWLSITVTDAQLLADIAADFDVLIMGADKWRQINELEWYASEKERQDALARLPELAIAPRPPIDVPERHRLEVDLVHASTSSTAARAGAFDLMLPAARDFAERTGAWLDRR